MAKKRKRAPHRHLRAAFKVGGGVGFFDSDYQRQTISKLGDPLEKLTAVIDWEIFREDLQKLYAQERKGPAGRKPIDPVLMFKIVVLQRLYNLSDDQTEYQIRDRASFQRFLGLHVGDGSPDAKTIWSFKERMKAIELADALFARFDAVLGANGFFAKGGQIVDAAIVEVPRQRNTPEENTAIKDGETPAEWLDEPAKLAQKDIDARWTKKRGETFYGFKNHINIDQEYKLIRAHLATDASVHDSQVLGAVLDLEAKERAVYADSAYRSAAWESCLSENGMTSQIAERPYRNRPITQDQAAVNRNKSSIRARVEHVFGFMHTSMNRVFIRSIGIKRAQMHISLMNLTYNLARFAQLRQRAVESG